MKNLRTVIPFLLLMLLITTSLVARDLVREGRDWVFDREKVFKVGSTGTLKTENLVGDISVHTWKENKVKIIETLRLDAHSKNDAEGMVEKYQADFIQRGDVIIIIENDTYRRHRRSDNYYDIWIPEKFDCNLETEGGDLEVEGVQGVVEVNTGGGDIDLAQLGGPVKARSGGGDVSATAVKKELSIQTGGGDIDVKDISSEVEIQTGGGDIDLVNVKGATEIQTGGGDIDVQNCGGELSIQTGGGDIDAVDVKGGVSIRTGGGDIDVQDIVGECHIITGGGEVIGATIKGSTKVTTGGGGIELMDIQGALNLHTGGGDVYAEVTLNDFTVDHQVEIETGCGEVELILPEMMPASVKIVLETKKQHWEDYSIQSDFPLTMDTETVGWGRRIVATGDLNGGGDAVRIYSQCGDIRLKKGK